MARVELVHESGFECFWSQWLFFLKTAITFPLRTLSPEIVDKRVTFDDVINTTKVLFDHGASVEFMSALFLRAKSVFYPLNRIDLRDRELDFEIDCTAMFWRIPRISRFCGSYRASVDQVEAQNFLHLQKN